MVDIFISYAKEDLGRVRPLATALAEHGWSIWWDRNIPAGKTWREVIEEVLESARSVIVLWSKSSVKSRWVQEEAERGFERKRLIPVFIDDIILPLGFRSIQAVDLSNWTPEQSSPGFEKLIVDISAICPPSGDVEEVGRIGEKEPVGKKELDDIRRGVGFFKEFVDQDQPPINKRRKYLNAMRAIHEAATITNSYLNDIREGKEANQKKEQSLSMLWFEATAAIQPINLDLADKCLIKGQCWSDPRLFNSKEYESVSLSIDYMFSETRRILHEMPKE